MSEVPSSESEAFYEAFFFKIDYLKNFKITYVAISCPGVLLGELASAE